MGSSKPVLKFFNYDSLWASGLDDIEIVFLCLFLVQRPLTDYHTDFRGVITCWLLKEIALHIVRMSFSG